MNKINNTKKDKTLVIITGFSCNNNCIMCSLRPGSGKMQNASTQELTERLKRGREESYEKVEFSGGEPTIRPDIYDLINEAKVLGYETIALSTNGRFFSYKEHGSKLLKAGLNKITFSLLGSKNTIHDAIARTPGSFDQIISGIQNVKKHGGVHVNVSTVISKMNYKDLNYMAKLLAELGVENWYLLDLIPDGNANKNYAQLVVGIKKLSEEFLKLDSEINNFKSIGFFDFPFCIFSEKIRNNSKVLFINSKQRNETSKQVGYNSKRITIKQDGKYEDIYRENVAVCEECKYFNECGGVWKRYLNKFGDSEINILAKNNNCLN